MRKQEATVLLALLILMSSGAFAAPLAASYKSTASITSLGPGTNACRHANQVPVSVSGNGTDPFGDYTLTEEICADPSTGAFVGRFKFTHPGGDSYSGRFNGTFFPSGEVLEVHATWRITEGTQAFSHIIGAGTAKGIASVVNGGPGPGNIVLDGSIVLPTNNATNQ